MKNSRLPVKGSVACLSLGLLTASFTIAPLRAQNEPVERNCFFVNSPLNVYAGPSEGFQVTANYEVGDIAYPTTNPPITFATSDNSFIEVSIYGGNTGWIPRVDRENGTSPIVNYVGETDCPNPPPTGQFVSDSYCFAVRQDTRLYSRPSTEFPLEDSFSAGDIAYATTSAPTTVVTSSMEGKSFVELAIYGGNKAWAPRYPIGSLPSQPILEDLTVDQCVNPGPGAAGYNPDN